MRLEYLKSIVYAARVKNRNLLGKSSSGGAFTAISDAFLENGDAVVCAIYNYKSHQTEFCLVTDKKARDQAIGSKYMQSIPDHIYRTSLQWLNENQEKALLFVGMGCQADGFRKYAESMNIKERVAIIDIICHGSPSPKLWREYAEMLEKEHSGKIEYLTFKDKRLGWNSPKALVRIRNGCVLTEDFRAVHIRADGAVLRNQMRGSKYIQSELGDTYKNVKLDLDAENTVLFSGTSCQIAGLRNYLGRKYEKLICVDIVCHGVPSTKVWMRYLEWQERRTGRKVVAVDFRDKGTFGWKAHTETLTLDRGSKISSNVFRVLFYGHTVLRPSCYECPYKDVMHPGDITIADYWGIGKAAPEFDDDKGVSLVLVNNDKGKKIFERCKENFTWKETRIEDSMQPPLKAPFPWPGNRDAFWRDFYLQDFSIIAKQYGGYSFGG